MSLTQLKDKQKKLSANKSDLHFDSVIQTLDQESNKISNEIVLLERLNESSNRIKIFNEQFKLVSQKLEVLHEISDQGLILVSEYDYIVDRKTVFISAPELKARLDAMKLASEAWQRVNDQKKELIGEAQQQSDKADKAFIEALSSCVEDLVAAHQQAQQGVGEANAVFEVIQTILDSANRTYNDTLIYLNSNLTQLHEIDQIQYEDQQTDSDVYDTQDQSNQNFDQVVGQVAAAQADKQIQNDTNQPPLPPIPG